MSGLSLEALNDIGQRQTQMLIVVNDNEMSISPTVGAFSKYLSKIKLSRRLAAEQERLRPRPSSGSRSSARTVLELSQRLRSVGRPLRPAGPAVRGPRDHLHRRRARARPPRAARDARARALALPGPTIVHVRTQKGRGFRPAETRPGRVPRGRAAADRVARAERTRRRTTASPARRDADRVDGRRRRAARRGREAPKKHPNYTAVFAAELIELARTDRRIVGITAGMPTGTGMSKFQAEFPDRMFDVGIAEQHSVALATGLAMGGMRPVVALYSTFLQRAFDQTVHDVCQNDQPVLIAVDRAGLVGEDGTSHQGMFTLPAQRQLPNLVIASPEGRAGAALAAADRARAGPPVRAALPARRRVRAGAGEPSVHPGRPGRGPARGPRPAVRRLRADRRAGARGRGRCSRPRAGPSA